MQPFQPESQKYPVSDGVVNCGRKINEPPAKVLVRIEQKRKTMEAAHKLSGHHGCEGLIWKVPEWY
jgi:hypothetical protein